MGTAVKTSEILTSEENHTNEIRQLENEIAHLEQLLEQKDDELETYLHILSHEIKTPIVTIQGYASLLQDSFGELLPEDGERFIQGILNNVGRLEVLVKDLLTLSGIRINPEEFTLVDLNELVEDILIDLYGAYQFAPETIKITENMPVVIGHRDSLRHVYTNLIVNSIKYCNDKVPLKIEVGCSFDEFFPKFFVKDNGVGVPSSARKKIFDMFGRAGNKKNVSGTGIGLVIVQKIVEAHGGEIWLESKRGKGTTFYFTLPTEKSQNVSQKNYLS
ncbi:MAG: HAMP domain-containing histidine kinase [Deferribacteres bacterium]|nr:HAMP domain-containing histidine kinase [candidate division KSB1 bacterium]MCB9500793.1 HAMP domain-containing histidine kinase [Deferribacteres bacterium]